MACFIVPLAEAAAVTALRATGFKKSNTNGKIQRGRKHLGTLEKMLYGGSLMLMVDHFFTGELTLNPPFFTAGLPVMLREMATVGVTMAVLVTAVWGIFVGVSELLRLRRLAVKVERASARSITD